MCLFADGTKDEDWRKYLTIDKTQAQRPRASMVRSEEMQKNVEKLLQSIKDMPEDEFVTAIHQLHHLSSVEASALIQNQLSPDGSITTRDDLDMMVITDQRDYVLNILESLMALDRQAPEVQIEVKIIELMEGARKELGVNWNGSFNSNDESVSFDLNQGSSTASPPLGQALAGSTVSALTRNSLDQLTLKISALLQEGKAKIMSEPKLLVANRHTGEFKMVDEIPWMIRKKITYSQDSDTTSQNDVNVTTTTRDRDTSSNSSVTFPDNDDFGYLNGKQVSNNTATSSTTDDDLNTTNKNDTSSSSISKLGVDYSWEEIVLETGITLKVTPEIRQSGVISLNLNPVITELQNQNSKADRPIISKREIKTQAYVKDGDTLALGGLIYEKTETSEEGVPVISKIPMLGRLFKTKKKKGVKTELLFLVRTRIVQL
jgi:type II secretory pathway component GspD/PulD (secretin)